MEKPIMSAGPHIHSKDSSRRIMLDVIIALLPASAAAVVLYGLPALWMILTCVIASVVSEFLFNLIARRQQSVGDLSAVVTGLLLALNLSARVPLWQCALGSIFAVSAITSQTPPLPAASSCWRPLPPPWPAASGPARTRSAPPRPWS